MADDAPRSMSIVPYSSNRDIVLRHNDSVVVLDRDSQQLVLRNANSSNGDLDFDLSECPYCHRPMRGRDSEPDVHRGTSGSAQQDFVNPEYFRLLHDSVSSSVASTSPSLSPRRPALTDGSIGPSSSPYIEPSSSSPHGISSAAFSQGYFKKFFVEEGELGRGGKGVVLLVKHMLDGVSLGHFACKRVPVGDDHEWLEKVLIEVQLLQHLSHQNLVSYRHVWLEDFKISAFSPSVPCAFILQQYCNSGDLHKYVVGSVSTSTTAQQLKERLRRRSKGHSETPADLGGPRRLHLEEIYSFFKDITSGIRFLHANGFIHRDLKPSNCLLHDSGQELRVLVSDFGEVQYETSVRKSTGTTGTISYCAPEVLQREYPDGPFGNFTFKSDVFSLGMILHFICFAQLPYHSADLMEEKEDIDELRAEISEWKGFDETLKRMRPDLPEKLYTILERLLSLNPNHRPTADEVLVSIQAGVTNNESRRFGRANSNSNGPDFASSSHRIQPIESPMPASSRRPSRSPTKNASPRKAAGPLTVRSPARYETRSVTANALDSTNPQSNQTRSREQDLILRPRFRSTPSSSPQRADAESSDAHRRHTHPIVHHHHHHNNSVSPPTLTPTPPSPLPALPALPPPPPPSLSPAESLLNSTSYLFFIPITSTIHIPVPNARLVLFITKHIMLAQTCMPLAVNPWVYYPLFILAVLSLPLQGLGIQLFALTVHVIVMALSARMSSICVWGTTPRGLF